MNRLPFYLIITVNELTSDIIMPRTKLFFDRIKTFLTWVKQQNEKSFLNQYEIIWARPKFILFSIYILIFGNMIFHPHSKYLSYQNILKSFLGQKFVM